MQGFRACGRSVQFVHERIKPTALLTGAIADGSGSAILPRLALGETMVRCSCCHQLVAALVEVPSTRQPVCARCLSQIRGMLGVWDVLIARAKQRTKPSDA